MDSAKEHKGKQAIEGLINANGMLAGGPLRRQEGNSS